MAVGAPFTAAAVWGVWSAPRAPRPLPGLRLVGLELLLLSCCCGLLALAGAPLLAMTLFLLSVTNAAKLRRHESRERELAHGREDEARAWIPAD